MSDFFTEADSDFLAPQVTEVTGVTELRNSERGAEVLDDVHYFLNRFVAFPEWYHGVAVTLWIAHTYAIEAFENTPRLAALSPEPGSGKTRLMELLEALVVRAVLSVNSSVAYIFRKISDEAGKPTLLIDEVDAIFSNRAGDGNEDLRGLLNSGYRRGATVGRASPRLKEIVLEEFPSFCAVALAGLNTLPDTLMTRSVIVPMKRRPSNVKLEPFRRRTNGVEADELRERLAEFIAGVFNRLENSWPDLPAGVEDRNADIWEPLLAVADAAGGEWPKNARLAAVAMIDEANAKPVTLGIRLLSDLREVFGTHERLATVTILEALHALETAPWGSFRGEPIDARFLARQLEKYGVPTNNTFKIDGKPVKGYAREHLFDAWDRYLPALTTPQIGNSGNSGNPKLSEKPRLEIVEATA